MATSNTALTDRETASWTHTSKGEPRGYIQPSKLTEIWFHTGTVCNLRCPFCLEGSKPGDTRIEALKLEDVRPFINEALTLGVEQFSFTGGEPFVVRDFIGILDLALKHRPCLVLTNATEPLFNRFSDVLPLLDKPHPVRFRVSVDYPDEKRHDAGRGPGNFRRALATMKRLHDAGFTVSIARQRDKDEDVEAVDEQFREILELYGIPGDCNIVSFPDFLTPGSTGHSPEITESCMTTYHTEETRADFMCNYSKMVLKKNGKMRVYACTLVDDDEDYDLGGSLTESMRARIMLRHHRCFSCFAFGASCSEK